MRYISAAQRAQGFYHSFAGWIVFGVAFVLLLGAGTLLGRLPEKGGGSGGGGDRVRRWPFVVALVLMGATWVLLVSRSQAEPTLARKPFSEFPLQVGTFAGRDLEMSEDVLKLLKLTDYPMRVYVPQSAERAAAGAFEGQTRQGAAPVWLYVG